MKKIMLLGSGELGKEFVIAAKRAGQYVIACDRYDNAPAMQVADEREIFNMLDEQERYLRKLLEETKPEECEKFNFLKEEIEKIVQRKAMLGLAAGKDLLSKTYKSAPNKNKIIPSGVQ